MNKIIIGLLLICNQHMGHIPVLASNNSGYEILKITPGISENIAQVLSGLGYLSAGNNENTEKTASVPNQITTRKNLHIGFNPLTWFALLIYVITIIVFILVFRFYTIKRIHKEKKLELDQLKLRFFINVSHELKTPLTLILNPVEHILDSEIPEDINESVKTIQRNTLRLMVLVNQLLDLRKLDLSKKTLDLYKADIIPFTKDIYMLFTEMAKSKNIEYSYQSNVDSLVMLFDPDKTEKILDNLLSNALKYTPSEGKIIFSANKITLKKNNNK